MELAVLIGRPTVVEIVNHLGLIQWQELKYISWAIVVGSVNVRMYKAIAY